jgi:hypothetical protein
MREWTRQAMYDPSDDNRPRLIWLFTLTSDSQGAWARCPQWNLLAAVQAITPLSVAILSPFPSSCQTTQGREQLYHSNPTVLPWDVRERIKERVTRLFCVHI